MTGHRLFFGLRPDAATIQALKAVQKMIAPGKGRPVPATRLHATLVFLGDQDSGMLDTICEVAASLSPPVCTVELDHCGHFPRASVVWLAPSHIPAILSEFQAELASNLSSMGVRFDARPWKMHVTLYRNLRMRPETIEFEPVVWSISEFELMESVRTKSGLEYACRGRWPV